MDEEEEEMDIDMDAPLAQALKRKRKRIQKKKQSEAAADPEPAQSLAADERLGSDALASPEIAVSEFDYSVENHFKAVDTIAELCGHGATLDADQPEVKRFSSSAIFLREWRDFNYAPRVVRFASQRDSNEKDVIGGVNLSQFSAASVPKKEWQNGSRANGGSSKDFVMHVGGAVWALDWCARVDHNPESHFKSEFIAVAAHPPESSYHKVGAPLTGRGAIQIWCLLTVYEKEDVLPPGDKRSRPNELSRPRGRPRKKPPNDSAEKIDADNQQGQLVSIENTLMTKPKKPRGRPRKKPPNESIETIDTDSEHAQTLAIEYPTSLSKSHSTDTTSGNAGLNSYHEGFRRTDKDSNRTENANLLLLTAPEGIENKGKSGEGQVKNSSLQSLRKCEHGKSAIVNPPSSGSIDLDSMALDVYRASSDFCDANNPKKSIPVDVALPRMMLCLAHNGKVAWDVKWRPVNDCDPESRNMMGYLAVLLGNGALEVWDVPLPHTVKLAYPTSQERIDPRFLKLQPVFRCSSLKCGDRQSIPLTVEWSVSSRHDMILAGCHDGVVALWKFSVTDPLTETMPLLSFNADTGPIRTLAWAPQSYLECANVIITGGHKGFKFWDIRDPFRSLWDHNIPGLIYNLDWLQDPSCVFGSTEDGILWLLSLEKPTNDIPVAGKCVSVAPKHGLHSFDCSSFSIWSVKASGLTGMVAYCGEDGTTCCFQPTTRSVRDPSRNRTDHYLCGSLFEDESGLIVATPLSNSLFSKRSPSLKRPGSAKQQEKRAKANTETEVSCRSDEKIEVFPPKAISMHRVKWNVNKGSDKWLCYGGAAGLVRCQEIDSRLLW